MIEKFSDEELEKFVRQLEQKIRSSYTASAKRGMFLQLCRAVFYLFREQRSTASVLHKYKIDVSLPYFRDDVINTLVPHSTISVDQIRLELVQKIKILVKFATVLSRLRKIKVDNKDLVASAMLVGYVYYKRIEKTKAAEVNFHYYAFVHDAYALIYLLSVSDNHIVTYVEWSSFIDDTMDVICDIYSSRFELVSQFAEQSDGICAQGFTFRIPNTELVFKKDDHSKDLKTIAFYSSSFYARLENSDLMHDVLIEGQKREDQILSLLRRVVLSADSLRLEIFYHASREVDSAGQAMEHYRDFLVPDKVVLMEDGCDAQTNMDSTYIGFTVISNVFWDCLKNGTPCFLYNPMFCDDLVRQSRLNKVCIDRLTESSDAISIIWEVLSETTETYRRRLFLD